MTGRVAPLKKIMQESMPSLSVEAKVCEHCGSLVQPIYLEALQRRVLPSCQCVVLAQEAELARLRDMERQRRIEKLFALSQLGARFEACTFEAWQPRKGTEKMLVAAKAFLDNLSERLESGRGLLFFGPPGTGKTHLAAAIVNETVKRGRPAVFQSVPALLARIRATFSSRLETEGQILAALGEADVVVLDDAGSEKWTEWAESTLYTIIDERYRQKRPLVITTNCGLEELEEHLGFRTMDRILEACELVAADATSYRRELAKGRN